MTVGVLRLTLFIPENHSLKGKRSVLRKIKARVRDKFNVSIAECDDHDLWQRATLGVSQVGAQQRHVDACLRQVVQLLVAHALWWVQCHNPWRRIAGRSEDWEPTYCDEGCGWAGPRRWAIHTYEDDGTGKDVVPFDECPKCGAEV